MIGLKTINVVSFNIKNVAELLTFKRYFFKFKW